MPETILFGDKNRQTLFEDDHRTEFYDKVIKFNNCRVVRFNGQKSILTDDDQLWIQNGHIVDDEKMFFDRRRAPDLIVDCQDQILAPGYIDIQMNGAVNIDFSSYANCGLNARDNGDGLSSEINFDIAKYQTGVETVSRQMLSYGVTSYLPTVISSSPTVYRNVLPLLKARVGNKQIGAHILGAHVEGPFITVNGAHPIENLYSSIDEVTLDLVYDRLWRSKQHIRILTLAPDVTGASAATKALTEQNIVVMLGHTKSTLEPAEACMLAGAQGMTHLYNAMTPFHHRKPHLIGLLASYCVPRTVYFGIIVDGEHVHDSAVRIAYKTNPDGMVLVSDACAALGFQDGPNMIGNTPIMISGSKATRQDQPDTLVGSVSSLAACMKRMLKACGCSIPDAIACGTLHPARLLGIDSERGNLVPGARADLNILDVELNVLATYIDGKLAMNDGKLVEK